MTPSLRQMRARDMVRYSRYVVPRFAGVVAELDGREIGAAAIVIGDKGRAFLSMEMTDPILRRFPKFMHRTARQLTDAGVSQLERLYAIESSKEPGSGRWLHRLGFEPTDETLGGERVWIHGYHSGSSRSGRNLSRL